MTDPSTPSGLTTAVSRLRGWLEEQQFEGWDPHDALNSPLVRRLGFGRHRLQQAWVLAVKASPFNPRRLLGVKKGRNPKGMGLLLASYWRLAARGAQPDPEAERRVGEIAEWLLSAASPGYHGCAWGYNFDWPNRAFFAPAGTPTIVNTAFIGLAFLDLASTPRLETRIGGGAALRAARSACDFVLNDLHVVRPGPGETCFSYTPLDDRPVHNASLLGGLLLAATAERTGESHLMDRALEAARFTARRQRREGQWPYGERPNDAWVDSFHTGYVLVALQRIQRAAGTQEFAPVIERGYDYWKRAMFAADGTPKYSAGRSYPVDAHVVAQAILTFDAFRRVDAEAGGRALGLAEWLVSTFQDRAGYFYYQRRRGYTVRIPFIRWVQAWVLRSLVELQCPPGRGDGTD
jgi:hypothetical protein